MKQQTFISVFIVLLAFKTSVSMESNQKRHKNNDDQEKPTSLQLSFPIRFVKDHALTENADDNSYNHRISLLSLMLLTAEAYKHSPSDATAILRKIKTNQIDQRSSHTTVTTKDLYHRLLSHIPAFGRAISHRDRLINPTTKYDAIGAQQIPVLIDGKPAYLNYPDPNDLLDVVPHRQITYLEDFTDEKEITSLCYSDCYKAIENLLKDIK